MLDPLMRLFRALKHYEYAAEIPRCFATFRSPYRMLAAYLGWPVTYPFVCQTKAGAGILCSNRYDLTTAWIVFLRDEYTVAPTDDVIVDCGANIGVFSTYAASASPRAKIIALEPYPSTFRALLANIQRNGLASRVFCLQAALSANQGTAYMDTAPDLPTQLRHVTEARDGAVRVNALTLRDLLDSHGLAQADLLKMDIEGSEHAVLLGSDKRVLSRFKRISLEYHRDGPKQTLFRHLQDAGFLLVRDRILGKDYGVANFRRCGGLLT